MRKLLILLLVTVAITGCTGEPAPVPAPGGDTDSGDEMPPAPLFELESLDGETWSLQALQGEVVILYFWTASCPNCLDKLPELAELQEDLPDDVNLLLLNGGDSIARVQKVVGKYPNINVLMNASDVFAPYGVRYVPTTIFIDRQGLFSQGYVGPIPNDGIVEIIEEIR